MPIRKSYIYFMQSGSFIKIGTARNPVDRLRRLQQGSPHPIQIIKTMAGGRAKEAALHRRFRRLRVLGEWFKNEGSLRKYLERSTR